MKHINLLKSPAFSFTFIYFTIMPDFNQTKNNFKRSKTLLTRILQGTWLATVIIGFSLTFGVTPVTTNRMGMLPLIFVSTAGAIGGMVFYFTDSFRQQGGNRKLMVNVLTVIVYFLLIALAFNLGKNNPN